MTKQNWWIVFVIVTTGIIALSCIYSVLYAIKQLTGFSETVSYMIGSVPFSFCMAGYVVIAENMQRGKRKTCSWQNLVFGFASFMLCGLLLCLPTMIFWLHHNFYGIASNVFEFWEHAIMDVSILSTRLTIEGLLVFIGTCIGIHIICRYFHVQV